MSGAPMTGLHRLVVDAFSGRVLVIAAPFLFLLVFFLVCLQQVKQKSCLTIKQDFLLLKVPNVKAGKKNSTNFRLLTLVKLNFQPVQQNIFRFMLH